MWESHAGVITPLSWWPWPAVGDEMTAAGAFELGTWPWPTIGDALDTSGTSRFGTCPWPTVEEEPKGPAVPVVPVGEGAPPAAPAVPIMPVGEDRRMLQIAAELATEHALTALALAEELATQTDAKCAALIIQHAQDARGHLTAHDGYIQRLIWAHNCLDRATSMCPAECDLRTALEVASKRIRDRMVMDTQMCVPLTSRTRFMEALDEAFGGDLHTGLRAKLMHSHSKIVCRLCPHAFLSNSRMENTKRRHGPRGKRSRDRKRQAAETAAAAAAAAAAATAAAAT